MRRKEVPMNELELQRIEGALAAEIQDALDRLRDGAAPVEIFKELHELNTLRMQVRAAMEAAEAAMPPTPTLDVLQRG